MDAYHNENGKFSSAVQAEENNSPSAPLESITEPREASEEYLQTASVECGTWPENAVEVCTPSICKKGVAEPIESVVDRVAEPIESVVDRVAEPVESVVDHMSSGTPMEEEGKYIFDETMNETVFSVTFPVVTGTVCADTNDNDVKRTESTPAATLTDQGEIGNQLGEPMISDSFEASDRQCDELQPVERNQGEPVCDNQGELVHDNLGELVHDNLGEPVHDDQGEPFYGATNTNPDLDYAMEEPVWTVDYDFSFPTPIVRESEAFSQVKNNYLVGCKWSPDGSCVLTSANDNKLRLFDLPSSLWTRDISAVEKLQLSLRMCVGGLVYDYCWYPMMSSQNADSCAIACTGRDLPVHLWDAFTGEIRCSYRSFDHLDELVSAKSIAFNRTGEQIYCGFEKEIRVFDTCRPGRECQTFSYKSTKKRQVRGQSGIMSSISFHYDDTMFAVGTYGKTVGLYASKTNKCVNILRGHTSGVTQVRFLPNGNHILSGSRKNSEIFCWDIRFTRAPVYCVERLVQTNQRMQFSTDAAGRYLVSGNHDGRITVWDLNGNPIEDSDRLAPICDFKGHEDVTNGTDFHPFLPIIVSASGQFHHGPSVTLGSDCDSEDEYPEREVRVDNSLKLWWMGPRNDESTMT